MRWRRASTTPPSSPNEFKWAYPLINKLFLLHMKAIIQCKLLMITDYHNSESHLSASARRDRSLIVVASAFSLECDFPWKYTLP